MTQSVDVVIVGAGVAGLGAVAQLRETGLTCLVLEAADRIGGRAWTTRLGSAAFDQGAAWLHMAERNPLVDIARAHGEPLRNSDRERSRRRFIAGRPASATDLAAYETAWDRFGRIARARAARAPDTSLAEAVAPMRDDPWLDTILTFEATLIAAADPARLSLRDWHDNALEGTNLSVEGGLGAFVARRLPAPDAMVRLRTPVTRIAWGGAGGNVVVDTPDGTLHARAAIVTVSTGVLAAGAIGFDPPLPARARDAIAGLPMGLLSKVALRAAGPDRLDVPDSCSLNRQVAHGERSMYFLAWPYGADHVIGFIGGSAAWDLARAGKASARAFALDELRALLGGRVNAAVAETVVTEWANDPLHLGAYAYALPGHAGARAVLAEPLADGHLVFAGEAACTDGLAGTVGGAWISGQNAARTVASVVQGGC